MDNYGVGYKVQCLKTGEVSKRTWKTYQGALRNIRHHNTQRVTTPEERHLGSVCPDKKVMCCLCFMRVDQDELNVTESGTKENVCLKCAATERTMNIGGNEPSDTPEAPQLWRSDFEVVNGKYQEASNSDLFVWVCVNTETGEVGTDDIQEYNDKLSTELIENWEWKRFRLVLEEEQ